MKHVFRSSQGLFTRIHIGFHSSSIVNCIHTESWKDVPSDELKVVIIRTDQMHSQTIV